MIYLLFTHYEMYNPGRLKKFMCNKRRNVTSSTYFSALLHAENAYFRVNRLEPHREDVYEMASYNCVRIHILSQDASIYTRRMQRHRANK